MLAVNVGGTGGRELLPKIKFTGIVDMSISDGDKIIGYRNGGNNRIQSFNSLENLMMLNLSTIVGLGYADDDFNAGEEVVIKLAFSSEED